MSAIQVLRPVAALRPLSVSVRGFRSSRIVRQLESEGPGVKGPEVKGPEPKTSGDSNKFLALGALVIGAGFFWFYRGGKPTEAQDFTGNKVTTK